MAHLRHIATFDARAPALRSKIRSAQRPTKPVVDYPMDSAVIVALLAAVAAIFGAAVGAIANYVLSRRTMSRSGTRLHADLELLEKARAMNLDRTLVAALETRVAYAIAWHTRSSSRWAERARHSAETKSGTSSQ